MIYGKTLTQKEGGALSQRGKESKSTHTLGALVCGDLIPLH